MFMGNFWLGYTERIRIFVGASASLREWIRNLLQGGHIPAKIKFPVFSLSFPCAR